MNIWAVILAAGSGSRLKAAGFATPKQLLRCGDVPVFWRSAQTFSAVPKIRGIVFVVPSSENGGVAADYEQQIATLAASQRLGIPYRLVTGGEQRQDSVYQGISVLPSECDAVLIHDAARPFVSASLVNRLITALEIEGKDAVIPGVAVIDTIKATGEDHTVLCTYDRDSLRAIQTPQAFSLRLLHKAHEQARADGWHVTDDAALLERLGYPVHIIEGEVTNRKITVREDLSLLEQYKGQPQEFACTGLGYDVHKYGGDRPFILGGVPLQTPVTVAAHSDGDTLLHALIDALLGCIGAGDIGTLFPDSDPAFSGISSGILLAEVLDKTQREGLTVSHVDIVIIAQVPKIAPHREAIAKNVAKLMHLPSWAVNVKATTEEHLGFTGEKKGIKVMAVVTGKRSLPRCEEHASV